MNETGNEQFDDLYVAKAIAVVRQRELEAILKGENDDKNGLPEIQKRADNP